MKDRDYFWYIPGERRSPYQRWPLVNDTSLKATRDAN